jgi:protein-tyrosine phosphatase
MNFDQITEHIFVGNRLDAGDWYVLASYNITVDINLQAETQDRFMGAAPEVYLWLPTPDWFGPGLAALKTGTQFIHMMVAENRRMYVHCSSGVGRAPALVAAYLISTGATVEDSVAWLRERRSVTNINSGQMRQLHEFAEMWFSGG